MPPIPLDLRKRFVRYLGTCGVPNTEQAAYVKQLRYYLDSCSKYHFPEEQTASLAHFLHKLEEKGQTKAQQKQASKAITLHYELFHSKASQNDGPSPKAAGHPGGIPDGSSNRTALSDLESNTSPTVRHIEGTYQGSSHRPFLPVHEANAPLKAGSPFSDSPGNDHSELSRKTVSAPESVNSLTGVSWKEAYAGLAQEIKVRHYSPKTTMIYTHTVRSTTIKEAKSPLDL